MNTAAKRAAVIGLSAFLFPPPDGTISQPDRQAIARTYPGIAADAPLQWNDPRASMINVGSGARVFPVPQSSLDAADRQHVSWLYRDVLADTPTEPVVDERNRGGWIDPAVLRKLRKQAEGDKRKPYDAKKRKERERVAELSALYDEITGTEIAEDVADVIRPVAKTEALIPAPAQIDMTALARNADILRQLERIVTEYAEQQEDEELLLLALVN